MSKCAECGAPSFHYVKCSLSKQSRNQQPAGQRVKTGAECYTAAYQSAHSIKKSGATVQVLAIIIGVFIGLAGLVADSQFGKVTIGGVVVAVVVSTPIFILGVRVYALGKALKATLDAAVSSSPLLTKDEMREIASPN